MTRQLFRHRIVSLDVQLDDRIEARSLMDRIRWLIRQDEWFKLYTREISIAGRHDVGAGGSAPHRDNQRVVDSEQRPRAETVG